MPAKKGNSKSSKGGGGGGGGAGMRCETCGYQTYLKARFTKHVKYHSMPFIKCEYCDFRTQYTWNLDRHMKNHNILGSIPCPLCSFSCEMKQSLTSHVQNHHDSVPEDVLALFRSSNSSSPTGSASLTKKFYKCKSCDFNALSEGKLRAHVIQDHSKKVMPSLIPIQKKGEEDLKIEFLQELGLYPKKVGESRMSKAVGAAAVKAIPIPIVVEPSTPPPPSPVVVAVSRVPRRRTSFFDKLSKKLSAFPIKPKVQSISASKPSNSTRCQYCRRRCKTSADLNVHLRNCEQLLGRKSHSSPNPPPTPTTQMFLSSPPNTPSSSPSSSPGLGGSIGSGVKKGRKVYKCPQRDCQFWAATASRFHVHIIAHYNTKPFECSQCSYRSNWRWDITKHIKLKTLRDPSHSKAKVLLTHKSGERNYRKYDRYLVPWEIVGGSPEEGEGNIISPLGPAAAAAAKQMPRLFKAPEQGGTGRTRTQRRLREILSLPPPPVLKPIEKTTRMSTSTFHVDRKMFVGGELVNTSENGEEPQEQLWRCKRCNFKHASRDMVISHINQTHRKEPISILNENNLRREDFENYPETIHPKEIYSRGKSSEEGGVHKKYHCQECPYVTDSKGQFIYHKRFHIPSIQAQYNCNQCSYSVSHKHLLHQHLRVHQTSPSPAQNQSNQDHPDQQQQQHLKVLVWKGGKPYSMLRCPLCPQIFGNFEDLQNHEEGEHGGGNNCSSSSSSSSLHFCPNCPARFLYEKELKIHSTFHEKQSEFSCPHCSYSARQEIPHLLSHMKVHSTEYQEKTRELLDEITPLAILYGDAGGVSEVESGCGVESALVMDVDPIPDGSIPCFRCPAKFNSLKSFAAHSANHGKRGPGSFPCKSCDYGAESKNNLMLHEILHAGSEITIEPAPGDQHHHQQAEQEPLLPLEKEDGNPEFKYPTFVKNGVVKCKRYKCLKCPSAFEKRDQFRVHMGLHGSGQRYKCTVCDYAVTYYANFIQHLRKHENQPNVTSEQLTATPFSKMNKVEKKTEKCVFCPFSCAYQSEMKEHLRIHFEPILKREEVGMDEADEPSEESDLDADDYEAAVKKVNKKKIVKCENLF